MKGYEFRLSESASLSALEQLAPRHDFNDEYIEHLYLFAPLHDIGKLDGECVQALKCHLREVNTIRDRFQDR